MRSPSALRLRLTLWSLGICLVVLSVIFVAIVLVRREALVSRFDADLHRTAESVVRAIEVQDAPDSSEELLELAPRDVEISHLAVRSPNGEFDVIVDGPLLELPALPGFESDNELSGGGIFETVVEEGTEPDDPAAVRHRLLTLPCLDPFERLLFVQVARPYSALEAALNELWLFFLVGLPSALLATGLSAWLVARRATSPLTEFVDAARRVEPGHLGSRVTLDTPDGEFLELQRELNDALDRVEAGYKTQERFISNVSHELRTPIATMLAETQVLASKGEHDVGVREYLASISEELRRLTRMLESHLMLTRAELGHRHLRRHELSIHDLILDSVGASRRSAELAGVRLVARLLEPTDEDPDGDPSLEGDPELLRSLVENLIRNAVRFSPSGEAVRVAVAREDEELVLRVEDRGPGLPEDFRDHAFEPFAQADSERRMGRGTGLGLAIAKEVCGLHGGTITARNLEPGCCFEVRLPRRLPAAPPGAEGPEAGAPGDDSPTPGTARQAAHGVPRATQRNSNPT